MSSCGTTFQNMKNISWKQCPSISVQVEQRAESVYRCLLRYILPFLENLCVGICYITLQMHIDGFRGNYIEDTSFDTHTCLSLHFSLNTSLLREFTLIPFVWCFSGKPSHQASSSSSFQGATKGAPWNFYNLLHIFTLPPNIMSFLVMFPKNLKINNNPNHPLFPHFPGGTPNEVPPWAWKMRLQWGRFMERMLSPTKPKVCGRRPRGTTNLPHGNHVLFFGGGM